MSSPRCSLKLSSVITPGDFKRCLSSPQSVSYLLRQITSASAPKAQRAVARGEIDVRCKRHAILYDYLFKAFRSVPVDAGDTAGEWGGANLLGGRDGLGNK